MKGVVITGARGALGKVVTQTFRSAGWSIAGIDRKPRFDFTGVDDVMDIDGTDLADPEAAQDAFDRAFTALDSVDAIVNLAGAFLWAPLARGGLEAWSSLFDANVRTCANMCSAAITRMKDGGAIVNVGAAAAERASAGMGAYAASKGGVARLTESLAAELKGRIRVNAILPLIIDTAQNRADMPSSDPTAWSHPAAIADVILFLAGPSSRAINGALVNTTAPTSW